MWRSTDDYSGELDLLFQSRAGSRAGSEFLRADSRCEKDFKIVHCEFRRSRTAKRQ